MGVAVIPQRPTTTDWSRPSEWPTLDSASTGVQKIQGVFGVFDTPNPSNHVALSAAGDYTVDWGDGSAAENIASGVTAEHSYDYADVDLTTTTYGYKCAVITITPQSGQNLTSFNANLRHSSLTLDAKVTWLDLTINGAFLTSINIRDRLALLEKCTIGEHAVTTMASMFRFCNSLQSVPLFDTSSVTTMANMFDSCNSLQSVPLFDTSSVTVMSNMFRSCYSLQSVPLFDTSSVTTMANMFYSCYSLQSVPLFDTSLVTDMSYMFYYCNSLQSVPLFDTSAVTSMSSMFSNCYSLQRAALSGTVIDIDYSPCSLNTAALDAIFTALGTVTGAETITITGNPGVATCDQTIATAKGWTVTN